MTSASRSGRESETNALSARARTLAGPHLRTTVLERGVMLHDEGEEIVQYDEVRLCRAAKARA